MRLITLTFVEQISQLLPLKALTCDEISYAVNASVLWAPRTKRLGTSVTWLWDCSNYILDKFGVSQPCMTTVESAVGHVIDVHAFTFRGIINQSASPGHLSCRRQSLRGTWLLACKFSSEAQQFQIFSVSEVL